MIGWWLLSCRSADDPSPPTGGSTATTADTGGASSGDTGTSRSPPAFVEAPTLRASDGAGLAVWVDATADRPIELLIEIETARHTWTQRSPSATHHEVRVLGLSADEDNRLTVHGVAADGAQTATVVLTEHPDPLPADLLNQLPEVDVLDPSRVEPGTTLLALAPYVVFLDVDGEVVWWGFAPGADEVAVWDDGTLWFNADKAYIEQWTLAGRRLRRLATRHAPVVEGQVVVPVEALHHDVQPLPNGHLLSLAIDREFGPYPTSESDPGAPSAQQWVARDVITELTPEGEVVGSWSPRQLLDPQRIGYGSVISDFWFVHPGWEGDRTRDWGHANALSYDPGTDTILVSLRHQDAVVALARDTGAVKWILGPPANWSAPESDLVLRPAAPGPDFRFNYHQHAAKFTPAGTVMMFDNGNYQASAFEPRMEVGIPSRAWEVRPDPASGTFEVVWSWGEQLVPPLFSGALGDADPLPTTDNVLVTFGAPVLRPASVVEVTRAGEVVWRATLAEDRTVYRASRVAGVFGWETPSASP